MHLKQVQNLWENESNSSEIFTTINHNGSYLLLFGKRKLQSFETYMNKSSYFATNASLFWAHPSK